MENTNQRKQEEKGACQRKGQCDWGWGRKPCKRPGAVAGALQSSCRLGRCRGGVLCTPGCVAASLSPLQMPASPNHSSDHQKYLQKCHASPVLGLRIAEAGNHGAKKVDEADVWGVGLEGSDQINKKFLSCLCAF